MVVSKIDAPRQTPQATDVEDFGVYVHWPFCLAKCPYCDFNSHVREGIDQARWREALIAELRHVAARTPGRRVTSIFFGGGTPSLMAPETAGAVIEAAAQSWSLAPDAEITLEANPTSVEAGRFAAFADAGVNRLSLGVQALDDTALAFLGRGHSAGEARAAIDLAARYFPRHSFDLIYARPGQTRSAWRRELRDAINLAGEHLSLYQLSIEAGTAFHTKWRLGELRTLDEDVEASLYEDTQDVCAEAGLPAYEISNHARPGTESRHNLTYWHYEEYVGIGPGAHGRLREDDRRRATRQRRRPEDWLATVEANGHATEEDKALTSDVVATEMLMMGLRLTDGVARARFRRELGQDVEDFVDRDALRRLIEQEMLVCDAQTLRATARGRRVLNAVLGALLA